MTDYIRSVYQIAPSSGVLSNLYTVTSTYNAILGSINICNTGIIDDYIHVAIKVSGGSDIYLYYNFRLRGVPLGVDSGNQVLSGTQGLTLKSLDQVNVLSLRGISHFTLSSLENA